MFDKVIGFISLHLPPTNPGKSEYEMSDLSVSNQAPLLTLSLSYDEPVHEEFGETPLLSSSPSLTPSVRLKSMFLRTSPRLQNMTREEVYEKLRKNISELERMTARLKHT
ncbi:unnamed protein product [Thelazia callipaeda]|uniref:Rbsn domain-containing protein n=1 Tax=Thelazia callipaeda TaxID=103827 RepID=A0A0N5D5J0_THECL|nr:unnamed protein product [Thelazia callipaeda]